MSRLPREKPVGANQYTHFVQIAQDMGCDESEERFNTALGKIVRHKSKPGAPPEKNEASDEKEPAK